MSQKINKRRKASISWTVILIIIAILIGVLLLLWGSGLIKKISKSTATSIERAEGELGNQLSNL